MATRIGIIVGCLVWGLGGTPRAADGPPLLLTPQQGVLVLRGGRVLQGEISRVGDRYTVLLGGQDEVGVPVDSVELYASTLTDAYHLQARQLSPRATAADHLALAEWCVRCELWQEAARELTAAQTLDPDSPAARTLERRLRLAMRPVPPTSSPAPVANHPPPAPIDLEQYCRNLPPGTVETFTSQVQPLLINRCGTSGCHGPRCDAQFELDYPSASRALPRRTTQRNLYATLQYVDRQRPSASLLLQRATTPHGSSSRAPLSARDQNQLANLMNWIQLVAEPGAAAPSPSGPVAAPVATQRSVAARPAAAAQAAPTRTTAAARSTSPDRAGAAPDVTHPPADVPRETGVDPFDPEVFNRRYLPSTR